MVPNRDSQEREYPSSRNSSPSACSIQTRGPPCRFILSSLGETQGQVCGAGIVFFTNQAELEVFFTNQAELEQFLRNQEDSADFIIQEFIQCYDLSCSVLCRNGEILAYTIQRGVIPGRERFQPPAGIEFVHQEQVIKNVKRLMQALKWSGIVNIDFIYDENDKQAKILEVNPRYWQSLLGSLFAGVNFP